MAQGIVVKGLAKVPPSLGACEMTRPELRERNRIIYNLWIVSGLTYAEIGELYGISRQRVHQIVKCCKERETKEK